MDPNRLSAIPIFAELSDEERATIAVFAQEVSIKEGAYIVHEGDYSYELMAIEEGSAEVRKNGEVVAKLGAGDVFGEMGLVERTLRNADVVSIEPMRLISLTRWDIKRLSRDARERLQSLIEQRRQS